MITVAAARPGDAAQLAGLMDELEQFYGGLSTQALDDKVAQISEALFGQHPAAEALLAWDGGKLVGFASYSFQWPAAGFTTSLFLKELYVARTYRRNGIGTQLMAALEQVARAGDALASNGEPRPTTRRHGSFTRHSEPARAPTKSHTA